MRTLAQVVISAVAAILLFALAALGMGGLDLSLYWMSAFDHSLQPYLPIAGALSLLIPTLAAIFGFVVVFHRLHHGRWLRRRAN